MAAWLMWMNRIYRVILKFRWEIVASLVLLINLLEFYEHGLFRHAYLEPELVFELIFTGVVLPVVGGVLLSLLARLTADRNVILNYLAYKTELNRLINQAPRLNELIKVMVEYPRMIVPVIAADLVVYEPALDPNDTRAVWSRHEAFSPSKINWSSTENCSICTQSDSKAFPGPHHCSVGKESLDLQRSNRYCQPLVHANLLVAMLYLYLPPGRVMTRDQQKIIEALAPEMAVAIDAARSRQVNSILKENTEAARRRAVRNLHDNLGHNLIYLRNQLDQLAVADRGDQSGDLQDKFDQLREVVDDAYLSLRTTLKDLEGDPPAELADIIAEYLRSFQNQVDFRIEYTVQGPIRPILTHIVLQIMQILKEGVMNIKKHAGATRVEVNLHWYNDGLLLTLLDNGGGFDPPASFDSGHMGLKIMQERAEEIKGKLVVKSARGAGCEVTLWLPLWANSMTVQQ